MYVPADGANLVTHQLTSANCSAVATGIVELIGVLNSSTILGGNPVVVIAGAGQDSSSVLVSQVRVDSLVDVQRRRQNKINPVATIIADVA
jgi:hypothetical protein